MLLQSSPAGLNRGHLEESRCPRGAGMRRHFLSRQVIENEGKRKPCFRLSDEK
jgi:hypothetical protein